MVGWYHRLDGHEFEQTSGDGEGQGGLACCSPWGHRELDTTEQLNDSEGRKTENRTVAGGRAAHGREGRQPHTGRRAAHSGEHRWPHTGRGVAGHTMRGGPLAAHGWTWG